MPHATGANSRLQQVGQQANSHHSKWQHALLQCNGADVTQEQPLSTQGCRRVCRFRLIPIPSNPNQPCSTPQSPDRSPADQGLVVVSGLAKVLQATFLQVTCLSGKPKREVFDYFCHRGQ